jgi:serine phosphatase RsbU (regulator of sigma subunit)
MEPDILIETVLTKLCESMHIRHGYFFVVDEEADCCICTQAYSGSKHSQTVSIPVDSFFCRKLKIENKPLVISESPFSNHGLLSLVDQLKGVIAVPLHQQNSFLGFILLGEKQSDTPYSTEDIELLATLADQVAVAFENGRLHRALTEQERLKRELEIARQIQMNSLPQTNPSISGFDIYGCSIPATEVGGDYYDYLNLSGHRLGIVLGDVSGKGTSAALYMSKIQGIFQALSASAQSPKELLCRVNRLSYETVVEEKFFMTLIAAILHIQDSSITFARAGHLPIFYFDHKTKRFSRWAPQGIALALDEGNLFEKSLVEEKKTLHSGDALMLYSDGLTEAENPAGEEFGEQRLEAVFCENSHLSAKDCSQAIIQTVTEFSENHIQKDDMTIVIVKKNINET